jgi:hypothetical protein
MNHTTTVRIAVIILSTTAIMIAGTYFSTMMQQQAYSSSGVRHQVKSNEERSQHMDQENLCLRTSDCNNSNAGEQTLGNDNSVTGFADQSKNIQNREVVTPTPTPPTHTTPIPALIIRKDCIPIASCLGVKFSLTITGNNPQPSSVSADIQHNPQLVRLGPGNFTITETPVTGFRAPDFRGECTQTAPGSFSATGTMPRTPPQGFIECDILNHRS